MTIDPTLIALLSRHFHPRSRASTGSLNKCTGFSRAGIVAPVALRTHAAGGRPAYDSYQRRVDLYEKAAPVFRTFGYRQVTIKALAHACGVSAPALYRYFPSKLDFALFPLADPPSGYCVTMMTTAADAQNDPLRALRAALEVGVAHSDLLALGVRLAIEAGRDEGDVISRDRLDSLDTSMTEVLLHCMPMLGPRARDLAHTLASLVVAAGAAKGSVAPEDVWRQSGPVLRSYLRDVGVDDAGFCEVFAT
jgi:AcrR family transcriptional regulator